MAYQIFRVAKVKRQGIGGCQQEHNRTSKDIGRFPDSNIDYNKTDENEYLMKSNNFWEDIKKILKQCGIEKWRKDAVLMNDAIYTASPEAMEQMTEDERMAYFVDCANWHQENFGPIINCVIHKDETTWHMHVNSVPVIQREDGTWKLSAKEQHGNREKLSRLQTDLYNKVSKYYNLERGEHREATGLREHKTKLQNEVKEVQNEISGLKEELQQEKKNCIEELTELKQKELERIREEINEVSDSLSAEKQALRLKQEERKAEEEKLAEIKTQNGEARAVQLSAEENKKRYKKAPFGDFYMVPGDDILAYENIGHRQRELSTKERDIAKQARELKQWEGELNRERSSIRSANLTQDRIHEKERNLDKYIEEKAEKLFKTKYEPALKALGVFDKVKDYIKNQMDMDERER